MRASPEPSKNVDVGAVQENENEEERYVFFLRFSPNPLIFSGSFITDQRPRHEAPSVQTT